MKQQTVAIVMCSLLSAGHILYAQTMKVKDSKGHILMEVTDEGDKGSLTLSRFSLGTAPDTTTDKLYNINGTLHWNGSAMTTGGWTDDGTVIRLTSGTDSVGIGTGSPASALEVAGTVTATGFTGNGSGLTGLGVIETGTVIKNTGFSPPAGNAGKITVTFTETFQSAPQLLFVVILRGFWAESPDNMNMGECPYTSDVSVTKDGFEAIVRYENGGQTMEDVYVEVRYLAIEIGG